MNTIKYTFAFLFSMSLLFTSCSDDDIIQENDICNHVTINIKNETGTDIHDFSLGDNTWGNLKDGSQIQKICFDELTIDSGTPLVYFTGIMDGDDVKSFAFLHWCGTGMYSVSDGVFNIEIKERYEYDNEYVSYESSVE